VSEIEHPTAALPLGLVILKKPVRFLKKSVTLEVRTDGRTHFNPLFKNRKAETARRIS
jgi:hypothetical protein